MSVIDGYLSSTVAPSLATADHSNEMKRKRLEKRTREEDGEIR